MRPWQKNHTFSSEFIILGFGDLAEVKILCFGLYLIMHLVTLAGHTTVVLITLTDSFLQTPMYFFLRNLSTIGICYTLIIVPNVLANFLSRSQHMPFLGCALQMHLFTALGGAECFLLLAMAHDRFVATCSPLRYTLTVTRALCLQLLTLACLGGFTLSLTLTVLIFLLPFCRSHEINHFFCDIPAVLFLACSDTRANEVAVFLPLLMLILLVPFLLLLLSYGFIIAAILRIHSVEGRSKTFSTCDGHLFISLLHYGCAILIYSRPKSCYTREQDKIVSLVYTNVTSMLYPLIYSLRNKEVKGALRRLLESRSSIHHPEHYQGCDPQNVKDCLDKNSLAKEPGGTEIQGALSSKRGHGLLRTTAPPPPSTPPAVQAAPPRAHGPKEVPSSVPRVLGTTLRLPEQPGGSLQCQSPPEASSLS
ncbi:LOW QUALITY PROTEIN: olfactory receptor 10V1-like [Erethizon dorsatum]